MTGKVISEISRRAAGERRMRGQRRGQREGFEFCRQHVEGVGAIACGLRQCIERIKRDEAPAALHGRVRGRACRRAVEQQRKRLMRKSLKQLMRFRPSEVFDMHRRFYFADWAGLVSSRMAGGSAPEAGASSDARNCLMRPLTISLCVKVMLCPNFS